MRCGISASSVKCACVVSLTSVGYFQGLSLRVVCGMAELPCGCEICRLARLLLQCLLWFNSVFSDTFYMNE